MNLTGIEIKFKGNSNWLKDSGYTVEQEAAIYEEQLDDLGRNPRWYLDQLEYFVEYKVSWVDYKKQKVTRPHRFVNHRKKK